MLKIHSLKKNYDKLEVLKNIELNFNEPSINAILGPNGSGKTTLLKCIMDMTHPDSGDIMFNNQNINLNYSYRNSISYLPQIAQFPENLTGIELINMIKDIRKTQSFEDKYIDIFLLREHLGKNIKHLSGGTKQKINTVISLMFDSDMYVFDEPTLGLDPISVLKFKEVLVDLKKSGKIVLLTTHNIDLVQIIADSIVFLLEGNVIFNGTLQELMIDSKSESLMEEIANLMSNYSND